MISDEPKYIFSALFLSNIWINSLGNLSSTVLKSTREGKINLIIPKAVEDENELLMSMCNAQILMLKIIDGIYSI